MSLTFEWDQNKSEANERKHGVAFEEAKTVFNDPFAITIDDPDHSDDEYRYVDIRFSSRYRILVVWYTERNENIRITGCRKATSAKSSGQSFMISVSWESDPGATIMCLRCLLNLTILFSYGILCQEK